MIDDNEIKEKCNKFNAIIEERIKLISFQEKIELINTILSKTNQY